MLGTGLSLPLASAPAAVTSIVDFETGPPIGQAINNEYASTASVFWQRTDPGFRPYRRTARGATHSGTVAADISPDHCYPGEEDNAGACEFVTPGTLARLTTAASSVTLYAGLFAASNDSVSATLTAHNANGAQVASSTVPIGVGITTPITVRSRASDIVRFELVAAGPGKIGASLGFDDLSLELPDTPTVGPPSQTCRGSFSDRLSPLRVSSAAELDAVLRSDFTGRVIVPKDVQWEMRDCDGNPARQIPLRSGIELIGERGALGSRPLLYTNDKAAGDDKTISLFRVIGNDVRVEGLHLRGPKPASDHARKEFPFFDAVTVIEDAERRLGRRVVIADNEFSQWTGGGVGLVGAYGDVAPKDWDPRWAHLERADASLVRIVGNYMHHNVMDGGGYGVVVGGGAYGEIVGNVFDFNRHAVAASGKIYSGYVARHNYVLQGGIKQGSYYNQHFDVHGTANDGYAGYAGEYFLIANNTIRGEQQYYVVKTRPAFLLRGRPGDARDHRAGVNGAYFNENVAVHDDLDEAVSLKWTKSDSGIGESHKKFNFHARGNRFDVDYSTEVASGDFDGDGRTDVFVANGTGWFFSRAGVRPWEFLHASNKRTHQLAFADIDNDHVTDVLYRDGSGNLGYLKSGRADLARLTRSPVAIKDLRFGDFDGDGLTDIFYTRDRRWNVWYGSTRAWKRVQTSRAPISELLFGEFDDVRGTDVASVQNDAWSYSSGATQRWARLNSKRTSSLAKAVAADFDGNGRTDIAFLDGRKWLYSRDGRSPLVVMRSSAIAPSKPLLIGTFVPASAGSRRAQVAKWVDVVRPNVASPLAAGLRLIVWRGLGTGDAFTMLSQQNMR